MAEKSERLSENVAGKFYVDSSCSDCEVCLEAAPGHFKFSEENGYCFVSKQPETEEQRVLCIEALEGCPCQSIGDDGDYE